MSNKMCNDCWLSMQNCHDRSICCEMDEYDGDQCDWFEPMHIVHGHWISSGIDGFDRCSNCKALWDVSLTKRNRFFMHCPRCGAKMDS